MCTYCFSKLIKYQFEKNKKNIVNAPTVSSFRTCVPFDTTWIIVLSRQDHTVDPTNWPAKVLSWDSLFIQHRVLLTESAYVVSIKYFHQRENVNLVPVERDTFPKNPESPRSGGLTDSSLV